MNSLTRQEEKTENRIKKAACVLIWLFVAVFFYFAVVQGVFGGTIWDKGVYAAACVLFGVTMSYWMYHISFRQIAQQSRSLSFRIDAVQICCYACICLMTLYYYNSGSEYGHSVATRVMNAAFGIALLCMYRREELQKAWIGYLQTAAAAVWIAGTFREHRDAKELVLYVLSAVVVWIYIKLLSVLAVRIRRREICTHISAYGWLVFSFIAGMVIFRNTRTWPFSVAVPFTSLYLYQFDAEKMNRFLKNFCYGCILAFWLMFGTAALFRPYYSFEFIRYPGWFSSVATAGLFWMLVFACTVSCILAKTREKGVIFFRKIYFEWLTLGAVSSYLFMTLSRTAALSVAVLSVAAFLLAEFCYYRDSLKGMLYKILLVVSPALLVFPVIYTVTRCGPAIVGRPVWITGAEWFSDRIMKKEEMDSSKYMNIAQLGETFLEKWIGVDINLTEITGAVSGPGDRTVGEDGEIIFNDNIIAAEERDGQIYTMKDYTFHNPDEGDISNGRFDLFRIYYTHLNMTGHDSMLVEDVDENITLYHAHNSYMQVAYDHGIPIGILFVLVVTGGVLYSIVYYKRSCRAVNFAIYPVVVIISFMIAGVTEWIFHPSIPVGFAFLIALTPLVGRQDEKGQTS